MSDLDSIGRDIGRDLKNCDSLKEDIAMRIHSKPGVIYIFTVLMLFTVSAIAMGQENKSLVTTAKGEGAITFGQEQFKIHSVVVKLFEDGKAEINLITDISVFITGKWSRGSDAKTIDLDITGTVTEGRLEGGGKLFLSDDRKSIKSLNLEVVNKLTKNTIKVDFVTK